MNSNQATISKMQEMHLHGITANGSDFEKPPGTSGIEWSVTQQLLTLSWIEWLWGISDRTSR